MRGNNNFDLIRLLAASQVMWAHSVAWLDLPPGQWWLYQALSLFSGVPVFFVVSGFLITGSLLSPNKSILEYAQNRFLRIYPALWVNILVLLMMVAVAGQFDISSTSDFTKYVSLFFTTGNDYFAYIWSGTYPYDASGFYKRVPPSGVLWTIPVEISFYILLPFMLSKWIRRMGLEWLSIASWFALSIALFLKAERYGYPDQILEYLWIFLLGATARIYWTRLRVFFEGKALYWLTVCIAFGVATYPLSGLYYNFWNRDAFSIAITLLMAGSVLSCAFTWAGSASVLRGNDVSYGLYLWHMPVIWTFVGFGIVGWWWVLPAWVCSVILAIISSRLIEQPAIRLKGRLFAIQIGTLKGGQKPTT